ncbi:MAG: hypothetical protein AB1Z98_35980 [Nannocystaceae bacterium]
MTRTMTQTMWTMVVGLALAGCTEAPAGTPGDGSGTTTEAPDDDDPSTSSANDEPTEADASTTEPGSTSMPTDGIPEDSMGDAPLPPSPFGEPEPPQRVGHPSVNYGNPEFTPDGQFMTWWQQNGTTGGVRHGPMRYCGVDGDGSFEVPGCLGPEVFPTTSHKRGYTGIDAQGPFLLGEYWDMEDPSDPNNGSLALVRPQTNALFSLELFDLAPDPNAFARRSIFPSVDPSLAQGEIAVWWLRNDNGTTRPSAAAGSTVSLQYTLLGNPTNVQTLDSQLAYAQPGSCWAPFDVTYARFANGSRTLYYGYELERNLPGCPLHGLRRAELSGPNAQPTTVHDAPALAMWGQYPDPYPDRGGPVTITTGLQSNEITDDTSAVYIDVNGTLVEQYQFRIDPEVTTMAQPCASMSHETFEVGGDLHTVFNVNDCGSAGGFNNRPSEIWTRALAINGHFFPGSPATSRLVSSAPSMAGRVCNEPEAFLGDSVWLFFSCYDIDSNFVELWKSRLAFEDEG